MKKGFCVAKDGTVLSLEIDILYGFIDFQARLDSIALFLMLVKTALVQNVCLHLQFDSYVHNFYLYLYRLTAQHVHVSTRIFTFWLIEGSTS